MRLWTKKVRKFPRGSNFPSAFSRRCQAYVYVRKHLKDTPPCEIKMSYDALRNAATEYLKGRKKKTRSAEAGPSEPSEAHDDFVADGNNWFDVAVAVSNEFIV